MRTIKELISRFTIKGIAHITGGGFIENIPRILPDGLTARIDRGSWPVQPIFTMMQRISGMKDEQIYNTFNMGIGMVLAVDSEEVDAVGVRGQFAGREGVCDRRSHRERRRRQGSEARMKQIVAMVSGGGSNLQAIFDAIDRGEIDGKVTLVISSARKAYALERARMRGIPTLYVYLLRSRRPTIRISIGIRRSSRPIPI